MPPSRQLVRRCSASVRRCSISRFVSRLSCEGAHFPTSRPCAMSTLLTLGPTTLRSDLLLSLLVVFRVGRARCSTCAPGRSRKPKVITFAQFANSETTN
jgi:hypothetical protein